MKKIIAVLWCLLCASAYADNIITSKDYVDTAAGNLQAQIGANDANTVLTYTDTAGTVGEKAIYDSSAAYSGQNDALVTAGAFNTAIQNALETEFVCIEWLGDVHDNAHCLLYQIRATPPKQILPSGYTQLEYIYTPRGAFIDTGISPASFATFKWQLDYKYQDDSPTYNYAGSGTSIKGYKGYWIKFDIKSKNQIGIQADTEYTETKISTTPFERHLYMLSSDGACKLDDTTYNLSYTATLNFPSLHISHVHNISNSYAAGYIYGSQMWGDGSLVQNLIPARRNSDDKLGMYDTVSNTFFTNAGAGEFVAGPAVSSNLYLPSGD